MTDEADEQPTSSDTESGGIGSDSTVTDWHGQEVDRDMRAADEALDLAEGDEAAAEEIFDDIRPDHPSERFKVPAEDREGTLLTPENDASD